MWYLSLMFRNKHGKSYVAGKIIQLCIQCHVLHNIHTTHHCTITQERWWGHFLTSQNGINVSPSMPFVQDDCKRTIFPAMRLLITCVVCKEWQSTEKAVLVWFGPGFVEAATHNWSPLTAFGIVNATSTKYSDHKFSPVCNELEILSYSRMTTHVSTVPGLWTPSCDKVVLHA